MTRPVTKPLQGGDSGGSTDLVVPVGGGGRPRHHRHAASLVRPLVRGELHPGESARLEVPERRPAVA